MQYKKVWKQDKIMHLPAMANVSSRYLATIIAGTKEMQVKSTRFYPYFGFCHIYSYFPAKIGLNLVHFTSCLIVQAMMLANY